LAGWVRQGATWQAVGEPLGRLSGSHLAGGQGTTWQANREPLQRCLQILHKKMTFLQISMNRMINIQSTVFLHESFRKDEMVLGNEELQASTAYESFLTGETDIIELVKQ
jgi:hypothetical protein